LLFRSRIFFFPIRFASLFSPYSPPFCLFRPPTVFGRSMFLLSPPPTRGPLRLSDGPPLSFSGFFFSPSFFFVWVVLGFWELCPCFPTLAFARNTSGGFVFFFFEWISAPPPEGPTIFLCPPTTVCPRQDKQDPVGP